MPRPLSEAFDPRAGLSSIGHASASGESPRLPGDLSLEPSEAAVEARLRSILQARTFERILIDALRPEVRDRSVLRPGVFHGLRREILESVRRMLAEAGGLDGAIAEELEAIARLLEQLGAVHDLGEDYRYALLKG